MTHFGERRQQPLQRASVGAAEAGGAMKTEGSSRGLPRRTPSKLGINIRVVWVLRVLG